MSERIRIVSFSRRGGELAKEIEEALRDKTADIQNYALRKYAGEYGLTPVEPDLKTWCGRQWEESDVLIFIGASGICVRTIAPYVRNKTTDPAVLVIDEAGTYVISLLSGHLGGANTWASEIAQQIHAVPVITTATDVEGKFAVDVWAKNNDLAIADMKLAKEVSAAVLNDQKVLFCSPDHQVEGIIPSELTYVSLHEAESLVNESTDVPGKSSDEYPVLILVSSGSRILYPEHRILRLIPRDLVMGIGCRKDHPEDIVRNRFREIMEEQQLQIEGIQRICSIDLKKNERGILALAEEFKLPFVTYPSQVLAEVPGEFASSAFVSTVTGVDNVCERAAAAGCDDTYEMILPKNAGDGVTIAIARVARRIYF